MSFVFPNKKKNKIQSKEEKEYKYVHRALNSRMCIEFEDAQLGKGGPKANGILAGKKKITIEHSVSVPS